MIQQPLVVSPSSANRVHREILRTTWLVISDSVKTIRWPVQNLDVGCRKQRLRADSRSRVLMRRTKSRTVKTLVNPFEAWRTYALPTSVVCLRPSVAYCTLANASGFRSPLGACDTDPY